MATQANVTKEESALLQLLDEIDGEAEAAKASVSKEWDENVKLIRGEGIWKGTRNPLFLVNLIGNQYERKIGQISESKPTFSVVSRVADYSNMAKVLDRTARAVLEEQETPQVIERIARQGMAMGSGFLSTSWDQRKYSGLGDVSFLAMDPRAIFLDPAMTEAARLSDQAAYVKIDHVMSLTDIRKRFPGRGSFAKSDEKYSRYSKKDQGRRAGVVSAALAMLPRPLRIGGSDTTKGPIERALVQEYWYRDPDFGSWPGGRHIFRSGDIILDDVSNEYWDQEWPIDMIDWRMDLDRPWGNDDIQDLKKLQECLNRLGDGIMRNALFNSQSWVIADSDAIDATQWQKVTNEGGLVIKKRPMREFTRVGPPALPAYLFQMMQAIPGMADMLTGNGESLRGGGRKGGGMEAVIDGLQTTGSILGRIIARRFESLMARVGQKVISRIIQFYGENRMLNYYSMSGELVSFEFNRRNFLRDNKDNPVEGKEIATLHRNFRFLVQPYSSMQTTKMARAQVALGLYQVTGGYGISLKRVLELADIGDPETLMAEAKAERDSGLIPPPMPATKR